MAIKLESPSQDGPGPFDSSGSILVHWSIRDVTGWKQAVLPDFSSPAFGDALRGLGVERLTLWFQEDPPAAVARYDGTDMDTMLERAAVSSDRVIARWRGLMALFSDPSAVDTFWDASVHQLFSWSTEREGRESEMTVIRNDNQIEAYLDMANDFQNDPSLFKIVDRVRRHQGFTRIETWHQQVDGRNVILVLMEADDLQGAIAALWEENNALDRRIMKLARSMINDPSLAPPVAKLLARWQA